MVTTFAGYLAGDKAALTKALQAFNNAGSERDRQIAARRAAEIINRAPTKGFTRDQVISGRNIPVDVLHLISETDAMSGAEQFPHLGATMRGPINSPKKAGSPTTGIGGRKPTGIEHPSMTGRPDEPSDDYLEPEVDDEHDIADDDRPIVSRPADWTITSLREKWDDGLLNLQPTFQREYVWGHKPELPSRLIESILLEIPIPPLYFGQQAGGKLEVIDGQQRLTTLIRFVSNEFALRRLTRMPSLNGKEFRDLSREYQEKIKDTPIRTIVIDAGRNTGLRYEIFERLNRGSMTLNEQELRNCVYRGPFNELLAELERDSRWRRIKGGDSPEPRFKEREMILRFLALANRINFYTGSLKRFLNDYMEKYAPSDTAAISEQAAMFRQTMQNVLTVFGPHSARLYIPSESHNGGWGPAFSISVLEIQASALLGQDPGRVQKSADQIREHFLFLLLSNENVRTAISQATNVMGTTKLRWTLFRSLIQPLLDDVMTENRFFSYQFRKHLFDLGQSCKICGN
jgi:hypothetical protein